MKTLSKLMACALLIAGFVVRTQAQYVPPNVAGQLYVNVDPGTAGLPLGAFSNIVNSGTLGGTFEATGLATNNVAANSTGQPFIVTAPGGTTAMMFDYTAFLQLRNFPTLPTNALGSNTPAPLSLTGTNPVCSIEVWALASTISDQMCLVQWGQRAAGTGNMQFSYGAGGTGVLSAAGAVDHAAGAVDTFGLSTLRNTLTWGPAAPLAGVWHHLVYTCDGTTTTVYADGAIANQAAMPAFVIPTNFPINIGDPHTSGTVTANPSGTLSGGQHFHGLIGRVRIHSGALTAAQVKANYNAEVSTYQLTPAPLTAGPIHNLVFNGAANTDVANVVIPDTGSLGGAAGTIAGTFGNGRQYMTGSYLHLDGGATTAGPFVLLPQHLITSMSVSNAGTGQVTVEGWLTPQGLTGGGAWQAWFSFGQSSIGVFTNVGAAGGGLNYWEMTQNAGDHDSFRLETVNNSNYNGGTVSSTHDFGVEVEHTPNKFTHYALSWNEATQEIVVYINGVEATKFNTRHTGFNQINDINDTIGRDQWGDTTFNGNIYGFRIYNYILNPAQVLMDYEVGPTVVQTTPLGNASAVHLSLLNTNAWVGADSQAYVTADYTGAPGVNVALNTGVNLISDNPSVATVSQGLVQYIAPGTAHIVAILAGSPTVQTSNTVTVVPTQLALQHEYSFWANSGSPFQQSDTIGGAPWIGTCFGDSEILGGALLLDGTPGTYMQIPAGMVTGDEAVTIETWASFGNTTVNNFFYGIGDTELTGEGGNGRFYMFASTHASTRIATADWDPGFAGEEQTPFQSIVMDGRTNVHWVAVYDPPQGYEALYLNGQPFARENAVIIPLKQGIVDNYNYIGKSLFTADPYFTGSMSEFRVFSGAMSSNQVALDYAAGASNTAILTVGPGNLVSATLPGSNNVPQSVSWQGLFLGTFQNVTNVNLFFYGPANTGSDNTNVVTISSSGFISAIGAGTTQIHATNIATGVSATATISVINLIPTLVHRYGFTNDYSDSVGGAPYAGTPNGNATIVGGQVVLDGNSSSVTLPAGILSNYVAVSFEAWLTLAPNNPSVTYLYSFGDQNPLTFAGRDYVTMSPNAGGNANAAITASDPGSQNAQLATLAGGSLDGQTNVYVAVVDSPFGGFERLYINGRLSAVNTNITTLLSSVVDNFSYLGQSLYTADPYMIGSIDEFRIWSGILSNAPIVVDAAAGPNETVPGTTNLGTQINIQLIVKSNMVVGQNQVANLGATYSNSPTSIFTNLNVFNLFTPAAPILVSGNTNVVTIGGTAGVPGSPTNTITAIGPGTTSVSVSYNGTNYSASITVVLPPAPQLLHEYSFNDVVGSTTITDTFGTANGTLPNGGTLSGTGQLSFVGTNSQYLALPGGILSNYNQVTIDMWVNSMVASAASPPYVYLFMFGNIDGANGANYIFFNPNIARVTISGTDPGFNAEQGGSFGTLNGFNATGGHFTVVFNVPGSIQVYTNGVLDVSFTTGITDALNVVGTQNAFIGHSLYSGDTYMNFTLDEVRIYNGALDQAYVTALQQAGPNALASPKYPLTITHVTNSTYNITWPFIASEFTNGLVSSTTLAPGSFTPVTNVPVNIGGGNYQVTVSATNGAKYYALGH